MRKPTIYCPLESCFEASQVKIHGPLPLPVDVDNIQEVEDDILDCIRVAHPTLQLPESELCELNSFTVEPLY